MDISRLVEEAFFAKKAAYAPYSGFKVGAALLAASGRVFHGCNVENASYGLSVCAERVAVFNAVSAGERCFKAIAVVSDSEEYCRPCGACRQVISEFGSDILIVMADNKGNFEVKKISELLPYSFTLA